MQEKVEKIYYLHCYYLHGAGGGKQSVGLRHLLQNPAYWAMLLVQQ